MGVVVRSAVTPAGALVIFQLVAVRQISRRKKCSVHTLPLVTRILRPCIDRYQLTFQGGKSLEKVTVFSILLVCEII